MRIDAKDWYFCEDVVCDFPLVIQRFPAYHEYLEPKEEYEEVPWMSLGKLTFQDVAQERGWLDWYVDITETLREERSNTFNLRLISVRWSEEYDSPDVDVYHRERRTHRTQVNGFSRHQVVWAAGRIQHWIKSEKYLGAQAMTDRLVKMGAIKSGWRPRSSRYDYAFDADRYEGFPLTVRTGLTLGMGITRRQKFLSTH